MSDNGDGLRRIQVLFEVPYCCKTGQLHYSEKYRCVVSVNSYSTEQILSAIPVIRCFSYLSVEMHVKICVFFDGKQISK